MSPIAWNVRATDAATLVILSIMLLVVLCGGCGATALQRNAMASGVASTLLKGTHDVVAVVCATESVQAAESPGERAQMCLHIADGYEVAVAAWTTWVTTLLTAAEDDEAIEATRRLAGPVIRFLQETSQALRGAGVNVPVVPPWLVAFVEGGAV